MLNTRRIVIALAALIALCAAAAWQIDGAYAIASDGAGVVVVADDPPDQQQLRGESELPWLFAVYAITWAAFFGYVFVMSRRQREMRAEIAALKRALAERE